MSYSSKAFHVSISGATKEKEKGKGGSFVHAILPLASSNFDGAILLLLLLFAFFFWQ